MENKHGDLSWKEDLVVGIQNLISIEEHSQQSFLTSQNRDFLDINQEIRKMRTKWMMIAIDKLTGKSSEFFEEGGLCLGLYYTLAEEKKEERNQKWCIMKHLLASSMRAFEVGNKFLDMEKEVI